MALLHNDRDRDDAMLARSAQDDPWVMYLVVEQTARLSLPELLLATTQATMDVVARHRDGDRWREAFTAWAERSFRKVSLRARAAAWEKVGALDHGEGRVRGAPVVRALPPIQRSGRDGFLRNLQVYAPPPESFESPTQQVNFDDDAMLFALNPEARMSPGKQVAQIAHAVLMCAWSELAERPEHRDAFARWAAKGWPGYLAPERAFVPLQAIGDCVVVRDAGLTEVTPGTRTVLAMAPGSWRDALAKIP